ncbi:hypothetical protein PV326_010971 [Microctonus aethiopoides]|uniref:Uncharacterized protein n=1 Tax=Microctonus aethiopoides TaxID=144406 RepID=A0AA39CAI8_9HYME|nr:hypothetical protein PV326_010971 [Microctonus aethiopoides]KAK0160957.1 hypothetical protein PV328_008304 [Microctonus aethiopoides]
MEQLTEHDEACILEVIFDSHEVMSGESGEIHQVLELEAPNHPIVLNNLVQVLRFVGPVVVGKGKAGTKALCQRGLLHRLAGRENETKQDFEVAAKHGSAFARTQLVNLNSYAAMRNAMLREINSKSKLYCE